MRAHPHAEIVHQQLESAARVLGLPLCFHDRYNLAGLPTRLRTHRTRACRAVKETQQEVCTRFDGPQLHEELIRTRRGRVHQCHAGFTEIVAPVFAGQIACGVLFAGPCRLPNDPAPEQPDLPTVPDQAWLADRLHLLEAVALRIGTLLLDEESGHLDDRKRQILGILDANLDKTITLAAVARELKLSASRAGHVIKELFGIPFPQLVRDHKLRESTYLLTRSDLPMHEVAARIGFADANYFSRVFKTVYGIAPSVYRRDHAEGV